MLEEKGIGSRRLSKKSWKDMMASYMRKEMSYRNCAEKLSQTTGLSISHAAVWNVIQALGDKLVHDEKELVETGKKEDLRGSREVPVLFEEADGVWLNLQGKDRARRNYPKAEMKAAIAYDGWVEKRLEKDTGIRS